MSDRPILMTALGKDPQWIAAKAEDAGECRILLFLNWYHALFQQEVLKWFDGAMIAAEFDCLGNVRRDLIEIEHV